MNIRNPYEYNPYALDGEARPRGVGAYSTGPLGWSAAWRLLPPCSSA